jgi:hypothetical protein
MTDELTRPMPGDDASAEPTAVESPDSAPVDAPLETSDPWLKEGADAPDAADIEDPDTQR